MLLKEVFNTAGTDVKYEKTQDAFRASTVIGNRTIVFVAHCAQHGHWSIQFIEQRQRSRSMSNLFGLMKRGTERTFDVTGSGNEMQVFGFVTNMIKQFASEYKPDMMTFTAKNDDQGRGKLYSRIAKRVKLPGYKFLGNTAGSTASEFTIIRDDLFN